MGYRFELYQAEDGNKIPVIIDGERIIPLNSPKTPLKESEKWASQCEIKHLGMLLLVYGLGNGMFAQKLSEKFKEDTRMVIFEPSARLFEMLKAEPFVKQILEDERIEVIVDGGTVTFYEALSRHLTGIGEPIVLAHPGYQQLFPRKFARFVQEIQDGNMRVLAQKNTKQAFGKKIAKNQLYALAHIRQAHFMEALKETLDTGLPALIVSSGPSLRKSFETIKKYQDCMAVFAVDSAVNFLLNHGITPDFIVTVDPNKWPKHLKKEEAREIPLFCRTDSNFNMLKNQTGPLIYFGGSGFSAEFLASFGKWEEAVKDTGGSVSTAALTICRELGYENILLAGQDFCYDMENETTIKATHAHGQISVDERRQGTGRMWIPGNCEEKVLTRQDWYRYLKWMEEYCTHVKEQKIINVTDGGAKIPGVLWKPLEHVMEELKRGDASLKERKELLKKQKEWAPVFDEEGYKAFRKEYLEIPKKLKEIKKIAEEVAENSRILMEAARAGRINEAEYVKVMQEVSVRNQWMESQPLYLLLDLFISQEGMEQVNTMTGNRMEDLYRTYEQVEMIYERMKEAVDKTEEILEEDIYG